MVSYPMPCWVRYASHSSQLCKELHATGVVVGGTGLTGGGGGGDRAASASAS